MLVKKYYLSLLFTVGLMLINFTCLSQSSFLDQSLKSGTGSYNLSQLLDLLRSEGIPLAYSSDKLPNLSIQLNENETPRSLLQRLKRERIIDFSYSGPLILLSEYIEKKYTINGVIKDAGTGEYLIGAYVQLNQSTVGTITNGYGYYSLTVPEGEYTISIKHIGYKEYHTTIDLNQHTNLSISAEPTITTLEEVEINSITSDINVTSSIPSTTRININNKEGQIPYLLGAVDLIQNALLHPGISTTGEDASGIHVRGGRVDQNLILLDEATIYNPNHYIRVSIFNPEAVNDIKVLKGFIPPSYGGRTSSVIEVRQKEGNAKKLSYSGSVGPFSTRALIEGPFRKGKSSFLASVRQSLINLNINDFGGTSVRRDRFSFTDVNLKVNAKPNKYNTYYLSGYIGSDRNAFGLSSKSNWGNKMMNFRWNHVFSPRVFSNLSSYVSEYSYRNENFEEPGAFVSTSRIVDYSVKADLTYSFNPNNNVNFGFSTIFHRLKPGDREPFDETISSTNTIRLDTEHALESGSYLNHELEYGNFTFNYGLRYSFFHNFGPDQVRVYQSGVPFAESTITDTLSFAQNEVIQFYHHAEPRVSINWKLREATSLKASYSKMVQYLHLISNTLAPSPTDIWKLSDYHILPSITHQYTLGLYKNFKQNMWESSAEVYYKENLNNIDYREGADLIFNENIETEIITSRGRAYGLELYLAKKYGPVTGWLSYTLSRTENRIDPDNTSVFIVTNFDKPHNLSTSWVMKLSDRLSISSNFTYSTGIPLILPRDKYIFEGNLVPFFGLTNLSRLPDYHRLDFSLTLQGKKLRKNGAPRKFKSYWVFSLYNVYNRKNVNNYFFRESADNSGLGEIVQYSIFGAIIPGITYNFKF